MSTKTLTLIIPGLLDMVPHLDKVPARELPELAGFSSLLSRGTFRYFDQSAYYSFLFDYFSVNPQNHEFPAAAAADYFHHFHLLKDYAQSYRENRWVMRADPCCLAPDRDQLVLLESDNIELSYAEASRLVDDINTFFQPFSEESFWQLELSKDESAPLAWFLTSSQAINLRSAPTSMLKGQSIKAFLPTGEDQASWLRLFNEIQMILHQSEVNVQRRQQGKLPVNSVWFWGAGQYFNPAGLTLAQKFSSVYSNDPVVKGLAEYAHLNIYDVPHSPEKFFMVKSTENAVVVMDHLAASVRNADVYGWIDLLKQFEKEWLEVLLTSMRGGQLEQLIILTPAGIELKITHRSLKHWWKRIKSYTHFKKIN